MPLLQEKGIEHWRTAIYYHYWQHLRYRLVIVHYGIRTKKHKLIFFYGLPLELKDYSPTTPEWELFDLVADPSELKNISSGRKNTIERFT